MNSLGLNFVDDRWSVFFSSSGCQCGGGFECECSRVDFNVNNFLCFFFLKKLKSCGKSLNWEDRIFDDFLECSPQSNFWLACPGSHVFVGKYSQKLLRSGKLNPALLYSTNFFIYRENQKNIYWKITLGPRDDNFADSLKILICSDLLTPTQFLAKIKKRLCCWDTF
jgi:hypothetical protein